RRGRSVISLAVGPTSGITILAHGERSESRTPPHRNRRYGSTPQIRYFRHRHTGQQTVNDVWRREYPFRSNYLSLGDVRLHYLDEGPEAGEPAETLLCVHGNPTWSFYWRHFAAAWRGRYRVVVPDHVGCGLSDKPQDYEYRLARHIANLKKLVAELDLRN